VCSVVGYIGKNYSREFILNGLERLEYRGYDSAGFACLSPDNNRILYAKSEGRLKNLDEKFINNNINGYIGIGHTRWATHGVASDKNAHPHFDCQKTISITHNGIVENHDLLRRQLIESGHVFHSDTDSEIIAHLLEALLLSHQTVKSSIIDLVKKLDGAFAFVSIMQEHPDFMILVRKRSPLCIGIGDNEMFVASDLQAFIGRTKKVMFLPDESFVLLRKDMIELYDFSGQAIPISIQEIDFDWSAHSKSGYEHYMVKEIYEQKNAINATVDFLRAISFQVWSHAGMRAEQIKNLNSISLVACGTSWHAARIAQFFFESICKIPTKVLLASEFRYMPFFPDKNSLYIAISQSGETADTLEAIRMIEQIQAYYHQLKLMDHVLTLRQDNTGQKHKLSL